jgi:hypothetical protein
MKTIVLTALASTLAVFGQNQPEVIQTPSDITIFNLNVAPGVAGGRGGAGVVKFIGAQPIMGEPVKGAPYSAEAVTETTQTLADGNRISTHRSTMQYRDGLGRERREETMFGPSMQSDWRMVIISDPVSNTNFTLNPQQHTAEKMPSVTLRRNATGQTVQLFETRGLGTQPVNVAGGLTVSSRMILNGTPDSTTLKTEDLGTQMIEGVLAKGSRTTHTIPAGQIGNQQPIQIVDENWFSPELQITVMTRHNDPREGETVYKLTNVIRTEPDPSLFQVPADYKINEAKGPTLTPKE